MLVCGSLYVQLGKRNDCTLVASNFLVLKMSSSSVNVREPL